MIVVKRKPVTDINRYLDSFNKIAVFGCGTCATVSIEGGEKKAKETSSLLQLAYNKKGLKKEITYDSAIRLCEPEFAKELQRKYPDLDAVLCLGCGAGIQMVSDVFNNVPVLPGVDTIFFGTNDELGKFSEKCLACGNCVLDKTGGICPISRCSKNILNGPCGGSAGGICEIDPEVQCAWQLIYDRLKVLGMLEKMEEVIPVKDWRTSRDGGPRKFSVPDTAI